MNTTIATDTPALAQAHLDALRRDSGISETVIRARGYFTAESKRDFLRFGFKENQWAGHGLMIPTSGPDGRRGHYIYRPDTPKKSGDKSLKYVNPYGSSIALDVPSSGRVALTDPTTPLYITEGVKKGDALATHGLCVVALNGVWGFKGKGDNGGVAWLADWDHIALNGRTVFIVFDSDVARKPPVRSAMERLGEHIRRKGGVPHFVSLPDGDDGSKMGADDYLLRFGPERFAALVAEANIEPTRTLPPTITWEESPHELTRPLDFHEGIAYATVPLRYKKTTYERVGKDGTATPLARPESRWLTEAHTVAFDGQRRLLFGPLAESIGVAENANPEALEGLGVTIKADSVADTPMLWSPDGVKRFLAGATPDIAEVFGRIRTVLEHYMDFSPTYGEGVTYAASETAVMAALWVLGSYFLPASNVAGYLLTNGPSGSGKTKMLSLIASIAYLGTIQSASGSFASLKYLAQEGAALCFDDLENVQDKTFDPDKRSIILAGNKRGVTITIMELDDDKRWRPRKYPVYCPKAFSSIRGFDSVLTSRTITIPLVRTASEKANRDEQEYEAWPHERRHLIDDLWAVGMFHLAEAESLYRDTTPESLTGRDLDPWRLILAIARLLDAHGGDGLYKRMLALALAKRDEMRASGDASEEV